MKTNKPLTKEKAFERLAGLCARSEQCEVDANKKLISWGINATDRREIIQQLIDQRYIDDTRYARSFALDKARFSYWGPAKIRIELLKKKIKSKLIKEALENVDPSIWREGLWHTVRNKAKNYNLVGEEAIDNSMKLYRYLISRGFPGSASSKAVNYMKKIQEGNEE